MNFFYWQMAMTGRWWPMANADDPRSPMNGKPPVISGLIVLNELTRGMTLGELSLISPRP